LSSGKERNKGTKHTTWLSSPRKKKKGDVTEIGGYLTGSNANRL